MASDVDATIDMRIKPASSEVEPSELADGIRRQLQ